MRQIEIEWLPLGISVTADLDDGPGARNPTLVDLLWAKLPYRSLQNHALVSGNHLYHLVPHPELIYTEPSTREDRTLSPDGTVFLSQLQHVGIKYGPLTEYLSASAIGAVQATDLADLRDVGRACWEAAYRTKQVLEVRMRRTGDESPIPALPPARRAADPEVQRLINDIHAETERVWLDPPAELIDIHAGRIRSRAGSYDQYLSTMVFVNGETRPLGYCALNGLLRACQSETISLEVLCELTPNLIKTPAEFLGYCGLEIQWDFVQRSLASLPRLTTKTDYFALIATLALYTNCLNTWNLHLFPWELGDRYPYVDGLGGEETSGRTAAA